MRCPDFAFVVTTLECRGRVLVEAEEAEDIVFSKVGKTCYCIVFVSLG